MPILDTIRRYLRPNAGPRRTAPLWDKPFADSPVIRHVEEELMGGRFIELIYLDVARFSELERSLGHDMARRALSCVEEALKGFETPLIPEGHALGIQNLWGDDFAMYFAMPSRSEADLLDELARSVVSAVRQRLQHDYPALGEVRFHCAHTPVDGGIGGAPSLIYQAMDRAMQVAKSAANPEQIEAMRQFQDILSQGRIRSVFQPIVSLAHGGMLGWEALSRGPEGSRFQNPEALFNFAEESQQTWALERLCRTKALYSVNGLAPDQKLFVNVNPRTLNDPNFIPAQTISQIAERGLHPHNLVFEITERTAIQDFPTFRRTLEHYRSQGYLVAVDDLGAGYSSLQSIAELRPDFIKLDMSLVKGIHTSTVRQAIVETFVTFATKTGCSLIAEGIETREELRALINLGVAYGQGFYLARPAAPQPGISDSARQLIITLAKEPRYRPTLNVPVESLIDPVPVANPTTPVRDVADLMKANATHEGLCVVEKGRPVGLVMRDRLFRQLGAQYGVALHYDRPVSYIMQRSLLLVEASSSFEQVARQAMNRDLDQRYDYVIVVENGAYRGCISVHRLLQHLTDAQLTMARHANPLTGMPGNPVIHGELQARMQQRRAFSVIYADLDYFKSFNDVYGFQAGDRVLLFTARLIAKITAKYGGVGAFIGHIGGDDFVAVVDPERAELACTKLIALFDRLVPRFYSPEDRANGSMLGYDRFGTRSYMPLITISLAVVDVDPDQFTGPEDISRRAAMMKKQAKAQPGSAFVRG